MNRPAAGVAIPRPAAPGAPARRGVAYVVAGGVAGLAWAAGLRGFMVEVAGAETTVGWLATFGGILLPGAVTGALLGRAEHLRRSGDDRFRRLLAAAPLAFVVANPYAFVTVVTEGGIGGAALAVPLFGIAGGYALAGRGRRAGRVAAGVVASIGILGWIAGAAVIGDRVPHLALGTPRGAWVAVLYTASMAVLAMACAIPHRAADGPAARTT